MKKIFILNIILLGHFMILSAQNSELIEPMFSPKYYEEPNGLTFSAENEYEKSLTQMWIVYASKPNIVSKKIIYSNENFKSVEMNMPYYVVGEDGDHIRLYRFEKLITYDGKKVLPNHVDNDFGWVNKNDMLLWSKSIKNKNKNKVCFKFDGKVNDPTIYYMYHEDVNRKIYLSSVNNFIIPNNEIENKTLINLDSTNTELFSRSEFIDYRQFLDSYFKQFEDSAILNLSYSTKFDKSLYEETVKRSIVDSFPTYSLARSNDTLSIADSTFLRLQALNTLDCILVKYIKNERDTFIVNKTSPFKFNNESEELCNRFLLIKNIDNQTYIYLPNCYWKPNKVVDKEFTKLYLVENDKEKIQLLEQSKSVFYTMYEFENLKAELLDFVNVPNDNKKFRKDFFKFLESNYLKKISDMVDFSVINSTVADLIINITGVETSSSILNISINSIKDKDAISDQKLRELKELIDSKFRMIIELESNNNYYVNEGLNKFYFIPKSFLSI
jgi:hypothetical protein